MRVCPAHTRRAVFVVDVNHELVACACPDDVVQPCGPHLIAHLHEANLQAYDSPSLHLPEDGNLVFVHGTLIDIEPDADATLACIFHNLRYVEIHICRHLGGVRCHGRLRAIPSVVDFHIVDVVLRCEVDDAVDVCSVEACGTYGLPGTYEGGVVHRARLVKVEYQVLVIDKVCCRLTAHDDAPRHSERQYDIGTAIEPPL